MADIFISYSQQDRRRVEPLAAALTAEGYQVWWDLEIRAGESFDQLIESALERVGCVVTLWSRHSVNSEWIRAESAWAKDQGKLVSIRIDEAIELPLRFYQVHTRSLVGWTGNRDAAAFQALLADIARIADSPLADNAKIAGPLSPPLKLVRLYIDNFKSLVDFELPLAGFSCLIGLNGSGKSTVLQAIDFMSHLFKGQVSHWLERRQWEPADLNSKLIGRSNIGFEIELTGGGEVFSWTGSFNRTSLRCREESVWINNHPVLAVNEGQYGLMDERDNWMPTKIAFDYEGSILSQLKDETLPAELLPLKTFMQGTTSLDLLEPQSLRKKTNRSEGGLGLGGERLSAFLHERSDEQREALESQLKACYPQFSDFFTRSLRAGWKELNIGEEFGKTRLVTEATHVNDGMLRLMAILAELLTDHEFFLFDEIENGINPELVEFLLDALVNARQQILVTTHSPMILNYLDDEVARAGVQYLYRTPEGYTRSIPFFAIPSVSEKLEVMGPGEAFVDTALTELYEEIQTIESREQETSRVDLR